MMSGEKRIRVLIVDDHPMVRQMVRLACQQHPRMDVVGLDLAGSIEKLKGLGYWLEAAVFCPADLEPVTELDAFRAALLRRNRQLDRFQTRLEKN